MKGRRHSMGLGWTKGLERDWKIWFYRHKKGKHKTQLNHQGGNGITCAGPRSFQSCCHTGHGEEEDGNVAAGRQGCRDAGMEGGREARVQGWRDAGM